MTGAKGHKCSICFLQDTVVIGVGNTILSDEGVGVHAARLLQDDPRVPSGVTILDGGTLGLELIPYASDASRVLLLDAMNSGSAPGTLTRMTGKDLLGTIGGWSAHQLGVADLIAALFLMSTRPQDIVVLGVQPANTDWGTTLSPGSRSGAGSSGRRGFGSVATLGRILRSQFELRSRILAGVSMDQGAPRSLEEGGL